MNSLQRYRMICTLSFGDIYGQIIIWLLVIFVSLAAAMGLMGASRPVYALATVGLILVLSLPFLLFAFVTTLLNHIEVIEMDSAAIAASRAQVAPSNQRPATI
jgi:quinol-cytochrome oxidoreductase complex cytochrome b subunit